MTNASPSRGSSILLRSLALIISLSFAAGFVLPFLLKPLLPPADPSFSYVAIAASFIVNLGCLAVALAWLPDKIERRFQHFFAWAKLAAVCIFAHAGLWASPVHHEWLTVFAALAILTAAQCAALLAVHAMLAHVFAPSDRIPKTLCALLLAVLACALFWSREPIQRLSRAGGNGAVQASYFADGVMKLSPPAAVAAAWYEDSDGARAPESPTSRRFDLVHAPLTYGVWIGSYQAVASPEILPTFGSSDFYAKRDFVPGVALLLLAWALPLLALCDLLTILERRLRS